MTTRTSPLAARVILYGTLFIVRCTSGSSYLRPMRRLIEKTVFSGLVTACRFATWPTRRSPLLVIATTEGVSRDPSLFSRTVGSPPSMTAITELVVPRSMPNTFAIASRFLSEKPRRDSISSEFRISLLRRRVTHVRRSTCDANLSRANDTFSQGIPWLCNVQDRSFRHICSRLPRDGLMPARIKRLSGCADLSHAQLVEQRRESSRNQEQALHPWMRGQLWWSGFQRSSKIIEHR